MTPTTVALVITGILISLAVILWFFRYVYDRGGPGHVLEVANALRQVYDPNWPAKLLGYLPAPEHRAGVDATSDEPQNP